MVLVCLLLYRPCAFALNPALDVNQYAHTAWRIRDGFPKGQIIAIAQTSDGYLWLGSEFGLLRFDGVRNVPWQPAGDQHLPSDEIFSLLAARDGTLWIGTYNGLASWRDGKLTQYPELAGQYVFKLLEDREGTVWVGSTGVPIGKLCTIQNGSVQCSGDDGSLGHGVFGLYEDSKGNIWAGVVNGLWHWKPGPPKFYPLDGEPNGIQALGEDTDGTLLVGWKGGIHRFVDGKTEPYFLPGFAMKFRANRILRDRDGGLWIGTFDGGLVHVHQGMTDAFAQSNSLTADDVYALFEDREGNIWVSTVDGLDRFRDFAVATLTVKQGLSNAAVGSVLAARDGSVWFATSGGLNRWNNGQITIPHTGSTKQDGKLNGLNPHSLFQDDRGRIWVSTRGGVGYLENGRFISISGIPGGPVNAIVQDIAGNLWIASEHSGLFQLFGGSLVRHIPWAELGHKDHVSAAAVDRSQNGLWLGFHLGGVAFFRDGRVQASYSTSNGLGRGRVNGLRVDQEGTLWGATEGGLSRLKNGRFATLSSKSGLPCDTVHWVMEDDAHSFWLYTACGLVRIARSEVDAWAAAVDKGGGDKTEAPKHMIQATVFDISDGVRSLSGAGHYGGQVAQTSDGRLWFLPWDGVSVVDPRHLPFNKLPPPVHIEQVTADQKTYEASAAPNGQLRLSPQLRDLQIDYTALSLVAPEKVLFRYKLEGWDRDWQDVGNRRQALYSNLPPGNYRFRVRASNNSGVWNEAGTFLDFAVAPAYYQTIWFRVSGVAVFLALVAALYQLRVRQVTQQVRLRMEARLGERERIARDLHDTLLQSVQGLILKFDAVAKQIPGDVPARLAIEKTLDHADQILAEGRDRVRNLRATAVALSDLPAAFQRVAEENGRGHKATLKTVVEGNVRELHPMVLEESYCIGREALVNALTHSGGLNVEVEITYDSRLFRLRVRDDGRGIDPEILADGGRPGHWGLQGMQERAGRIGAELKQWSRLGVGTEVELIVPGATAYRARATSKSS